MIDKTPIENIPIKQVNDKHFASEFNTSRQFWLDLADEINSREAGYKGYLKKSDTLFLPGLYRLIEIGTYSNLTPAEDENGNPITIIAEDGKLTEAYYDGFVWIQNEITLPQAENNIASDEEFKNKVSDKAVNPEQFFGVIGDYEFEGQIIQEVQDYPFTGFDINQASNPINAGIWTYADYLYSDFESITAVDINFAGAGVFNIYIYAKNDLSTPSQTIPISTDGGITRHTFTEPINAATHKVFISVGGRYYVNNESLGVQNIVSNALNDNPTIALGMILYSEKEVLVNSKPIIERLENLENIDFFTNYLYNQSGNQISNISSDGGTFEINSAGLQINSGGVTLDKQTNLSQRYLELKLKLNTSSKIYIGTKNIENQVGETLTEIDCSAKTLKINPLGSTGGTKVFPFDIVNDRDYIVRLFKLDNITRLQIIDTVTSESDYLDDQQLAQFDKYKFGLLPGSTSVTISEVSIKSLLTERPYIGFYGDSITEGNSVGSDSKTPYYKDRFANLIGDKLGKSYYVSGRSSGTIDGVLARMETELPILRPKYVFVTIGTNGGNTELKLNHLVDYCELLGITVILNLIPLYDGSTTGKNALIQSVITSRNLMSVKMNIATSINGDGVTKDNSKFVNESGILIHPNESGNLAVFKRSLIDMNKVYSEVGVF